MVAWCVGWGRLLASVIFKRSHWSSFPLGVAVALMSCSRLHAWLSARSQSVALLSSLVARQWVGLQILLRFQLRDLSIDRMVRAWCFGCLSSPQGFACWISFAPVFVFLLLGFCLCFISLLYLDLYVLGDDAVIRAV